MEIARKLARRFRCSGWWVTTGGIGAITVNLGTPNGNGLNVYKTVEVFSID
jgi:hypothetical protein